jgi:hypothetical protein
MGYRRERVEWERRNEQGRKSIREDGKEGVGHIKIYKILFIATIFHTNVI